MIKFQNQTFHYTPLSGTYLFPFLRNITSSGLRICCSAATNLAYIAVTHRTRDRKVSSSMLTCR